MGVIGFFACGLRECLAAQCNVRHELCWVSFLYSPQGFQVCAYEIQVIGSGTFEAVRMVAKIVAA